MNDNQLFHHTFFRQPEAAQQFIRLQSLLARKLEGADADKAIFGSNADIVFPVCLQGSGSQLMGFPYLLRLEIFTTIDSPLDWTNSVQAAG